MRKSRFKVIIGEIVKQKYCVRGNATGTSLRRPTVRIQLQHERSYRSQYRRVFVDVLVSFKFVRDGKPSSASPVTELSISCTCKTFSAHFFAMKTSFPSTFSVWIGLCCFTLRVLYAQTWLAVPPPPSSRASWPDAAPRRRTTAVNDTPLPDRRALAERYPPSTWTSRTSNERISLKVRQLLKDSEQSEALDLCGKFLYSSLRRAVHV